MATLARCHATKQTSERIARNRWRTLAVTPRCVPVRPGIRLWRDGRLAGAGPSIRVIGEGVAMATAVLEAKHGGLDTAVRLVTPERITFRYPLAGPFRRAAAYLVDLVILLCLCLVGLMLSLVFSLGSAAGLGIFLVALFGLRFGYGALFEGLLQRPDPRQAGVPDPGRLGRGGADRRIAGVPPESALVPRRRPAVRLYAGVGVHDPLAEIPKARRPRGPDDGDRRASPEAGRGPSDQRRGGQAVTDAAAGLDRRRSGAGSRALSDYAEVRERLATAHREEMAAPLARPARVKYNLPDDANGRCGRLRPLPPRLPGGLIGREGRRTPRPPGVDLARTRLARHPFRTLGRPASPTIGLRDPRGRPPVADQPATGRRAPPRSSAWGSSTAPPART